MNDDGWKYPINECYQPYMVELMAFFHGCIEYPGDQQFTREELLELTPLDIKQWLANKAFGDPDYNVQRGDRPVYARSSTLEFAKKSVSFFMPNRVPPWVNGAGNPTKSAAVNDMLREVKKFEVRGEGVGDCSMRPITEQEFRMTIHLFRAQHDWITSWKYSTMALWQYHLIGRIDDVVHFKISDPRSHDRFDFAVQTKVRWSKNVMEERCCPDQILLGAMDPLFCILANLGLYLESYLGSFPQSRYLFTPNDASTAPVNLIQAYRSKLESAVFKNSQFTALSHTDLRGVGTHSYRKFPSQYSVDKGASAEDVEIRGRWKTRGRRIVFRYIDPGQLYTDAKVASLLCVGGPVKYKLKNGIAISNDWLFEHVVPMIRQRYHNDLNFCTVMALAILFAALDESIDVPLRIRNRVKLAYSELGLEETQPVMKVALHVYRIEDRLMIDEVEPVSDNNGVSPNILVRLDRLERQNAELYRHHEGSLQRLETVFTTNFHTINNNIRRFGGTIEGSMLIQRGATRGSRQRLQGGNEKYPSLSHNPRTLLELWYEYKHGIDGRKPAQHFDMTERNVRVGGLKQKYYRRNVVWKCMQRLVRSGDTPEVAADKIHQAYGFSLTVTQIINAMIRDNRRGGHPNLR